MSTSRRPHFRQLSGSVDLETLRDRLSGALGAEREVTSDATRREELLTLANRMFSNGEAAADSPTLSILQILGSRWTPLILLVLASGTYRHSELLRVINILSDGSGTSHISPHVLTVKLRELERSGMLLRKIWPEVPPRTDYTLTELGHALTACLDDVVNWSVRNARPLKEAREASLPPR